MKNIIKASVPSSAVALSLLIGSVQPVSAQEKQASESQLGPYIQIGIGTGLGKTVDGDLHGQSVSADERNVLVGGIGIGYDFGSIRADISAHRWHDIDSFSVGGHKYDSDVNNYFWRVGLGLALDIPTNSNWTPYLHAGGGPIWGDKTNNAAWAFGGGIGVTYAASEGVDVFDQVIYGWAPPQTIDNVNTDASGALGVEAGLRFRL